MKNGSLEKFWLPFVAGLIGYAVALVLAFILFARGNLNWGKILLMFLFILVVGITGQLLIDRALKMATNVLRKSRKR